VKRAKFNNRDLEAEHKLSVAQIYLTHFVDESKPLKNAYDWIAKHQNSENKNMQVLAELSQYLKPIVRKFKPQIDLKKFKKIYHPRNTNITRAMAEELEIYIHGPYVALRADSFEDFVNERIINRNDNGKPNK
jgi:hypothetical protein